MRVNLYKGIVSNASHLPQLPHYKRLLAALQPHYTRTRMAAAAAGASLRPVHMLTPEEVGVGLWPSLAAVLMLRFHVLGPLRRLSFFMSAISVYLSVMCDEPDSLSLASVLCVPPAKCWA